MITKFKLPKFDTNMEEGTVGSWVKSAGDEVSKGDPLVEVVTDKTTYEIQATQKGILRKIIAPERSVICPGVVMALIGDVNDELPDVSAENQKLMDQLQADNLLDIQPIKKKETSKKSSKVRATPSAKKLALDNGIELESVRNMFDAKVVNEKMVQDFLDKEQ